LVTIGIGLFSDVFLEELLFGTRIYYQLLYEIKIIQSIKQIFKKEKSSDSRNELTSEQQTEIKKPIEEINQGKVTDYDSLLANYR